MWSSTWSQTLLGFQDRRWRQQVSPNISNHLRFFIISLPRQPLTISTAIIILNLEHGKVVGQGKKSYVNKYTKQNMERVGTYTKGGFMDEHRRRWITLS